MHTLLLSTLHAKENDVVVCVGAGLGHEAIWLANKANDIRYIGIEVQPYLYELLSNTFNQKTLTLLVIWQ